MKILLIDNYDSFTYNLVHAVRKLGFQELEVHRNDKIALADIARFDKILLSPGPGIPSESGLLMEIIEQYAPQKSILGVCLGMQAIAQVFGGSLINLSRVYHGIASPIRVLKQDILFDKLPAVFEAGRYHSWAVSGKELPACLEKTAEDEQGMIMALRHRSLDVRGVQFHPESVLTPCGEQLIHNWLLA
jgi:anthranilate synthase component 2